RFDRLAGVLTEPPTGSRGQLRIGRRVLAVLVGAERTARVQPGHLFLRFRQGVWHGTSLLRPNEKAQQRRPRREPCYSEKPRTRPPSGGAQAWVNRPTLPQHPASIIVCPSYSTPFLVRVYQLFHPR